MQELKTLKDLKIERGKRVGIKDPNDCLIDPDELKQEAIKDIKFFRKNRSSNPEYSKQELNGIEKYIKWKFNITEEVK